MQLSSNCHIIKLCRLCGNKRLKTAINLHDTPLANSFLKLKTLKNKEKFYPLKVKFCLSCSHLQLSHSVSSKILFQNYLYVTGTSPVTRKHFKIYALDLIRRIKESKKIKVLDIASNDGTFLKNFKGKKVTKLGVDPAQNLHRIAKKSGITQLPIFFNYKNSLKIKSRFGTFQIIAANNVCAHVDDLYDFVKGVKNLLSKNGIFVFEVSYLADVISKKTLDTIYHEHVDYHSFKPLINFFKKFNLEIFDFKRVKIQGGSIRIFVSHINNRKINQKKINKLIKLEQNNYKLFNLKTYKKFQKEINFHKNKLKKILIDIKKRNFTIAGFGAPAKTTTLLNYYKIGKNLISFIVDDNVFKHNRFTPGTRIPIYSSQSIYKLNPDYVIILAWNYSDAIIETHKRFLKSGGKFIKIFPKIKVLKN